MALASLGVAVLPAWLIEQDLANGSLQRVLPDYSLPKQPISVVYPNGSHKAAAHAGVHRFSLRAPGPLSVRFRAPARSRAG